MTSMHATQGQIIETRLAQMGMTVYRLAKITGMNESNLRNVMAGKRALATPETIDPLVAALEMDSADPFYLAIDKVPPDVLAAILRHPQLVTAIRNLARKLDTQQEDTNG